jgi:hypothetical protein
MATWTAGLYQPRDRGSEQALTRRHPCGKFDLAATCAQSYVGSGAFYIVPGRFVICVPSGNAGRRRNRLRRHIVPLIRIAHKLDQKCANVQPSGHTDLASMFGPGALIRIYLRGYFRRRALVASVSGSSPRREAPAYRDRMEQEQPHPVMAGPKRPLDSCQGPPLPRWPCSSRVRFKRAVHHLAVRRTVRWHRSPFRYNPKSSQPTGGNHVRVLRNSHPAHRVA